MSSPKVGVLYSRVRVEEKLLFEAFEKRGVQYREITMDWWMKHPEIDQKRAELIKILTTKE